MKVNPNVKKETTLTASDTCSLLAAMMGATALIAEAPHHDAPTAMSITTVASQCIRRVPIKNPNMIDNGEPTQATTIPGMPTSINSLNCTANKTKLHLIKNSPSVAASPM